MNSSSPFIRSTESFKDLLEVNAVGSEDLSRASTSSITLWTDSLLSSALLFPDLVDDDPPGTFNFLDFFKETYSEDSS